MEKLSTDAKSLSGKKHFHRKRSFCCFDPFLAKFFGSDSFSEEVKTDFFRSSAATIPGKDSRRKVFRGNGRKSPPPKKISFFGSKVFASVGPFPGGTPSIRPCTWACVLRSTAFLLVVAVTNEIMALSVVIRWLAYGNGIYEVRKMGCGAQRLQFEHVLSSSVYAILHLLFLRMR